VDLERAAAGAAGAADPTVPTRSAGPAVLANLSVATKNACIAIAAATATAAAATTALSAAAAATAAAAGTAAPGGQDDRGAAAIHAAFATDPRGPDRPRRPTQAGIRRTVRPDLARMARLAVSRGGDAEVEVKMGIRPTGAAAARGPGGHAVQDDLCAP